MITFSSSYSLIKNALFSSVVVLGCLSITGAAQANCDRLQQQYHQAASYRDGWQQHADKIYANDFKPAESAVNRLRSEIRRNGCNRRGSDSNVCAPLERDLNVQRAKMQKAQNEHNQAMTNLGINKRNAQQLKPQADRCAREAAARPRGPFDPRFAPPPAPRLTPQQQQQAARNRANAANVIGFIGTLATTPGGLGGFIGRSGGGSASAGSRCPDPKMRWSQQNGCHYPGFGR